MSEESDENLDYRPGFWLVVACMLPFMAMTYVLEWLKVPVVEGCKYDE